MSFPFRKIIQFAMTKSDEVDAAYTSFFGDLPFSELKKEWEELFLEWLIFDHKSSKGISFLMEYILKNPDRSNDDLLDQLSQIVQTQFYSNFEITRIQRGDWIDVVDLFSGKKYKIYEKKGSMSLPDVGMVPGRIAKYNNKWYLVGANSVYFPITYTERAKRNFKKMKVKNFSPKDTVELLRSHERSDSQTVSAPTPKELKQKRKYLEEEYKKIAEKSGITYTFKELLDAIFSENQVNFLDFWQDLGKKGLQLEVIIENTELFQDTWNYFPHKCLNNFSPIEVYSKVRNKEK